MINNNLNPLTKKKIIYSKNKAKPQFIKHPNQKKYETQKRKKSYLYQNDACEISSPSLSLSYHFDASCFFFHLLIHHYEKINKCWQIKRITIHIKGKKKEKIETFRIRRWTSLPTLLLLLLRLSIASHIWFATVMWFANQCMRLETRKRLSCFGFLQLSSACL